MHSASLQTEVCQNARPDGILLSAFVLDGRITMTRPILDALHLHPAIRDRVEQAHADTIAAVQAAIAVNNIVVVGMRQNPFPKKARRALAARGLAHSYIEYGSYFKDWRRRGALKMWTGWPTFPMIFVKGVLVGGADDLQKLLDSGEIDRLLA